MAQQTFEEIADAVMQAESRGKRYKDDGKTLTTSAKGALGEMQVMPKTVKDPGFGVVPAKDKSPDEIARVGRDYLQAMLGKYGDTEKALIADNWGPGSTDKWIASGAKPDKLPEETRTYVQRVKGFLGGKDVPRETSVVKKEREPLPASLPPMAQADIKAPSVKPEAAARVASLGPGYQAALALSFLADTDDEEDRKTTITQEFMAKAQEEEDDRAAAVAARTRQANVFADLSNTTIRSPFPQPQQPVRMKEGGEVSEAKDIARKGEAYQELEKYLQSRDAMPSIKIGNLGSGATNAVFTSDRANFGDGAIMLSKDTSKTFMPSILTHEMTHAADRQMMQQALEQGMFGKNNQFTEAYKKMVGPEGRNRTLLLRKRYPEFEQDNRYYRSEPKEVAAHGVGAYAGPNIQDRAPRHVDATAATEFQILLDLAQRNVDKGPTGLGKILPFFRKLERYADGGPVYRAEGSPPTGERKLDRETITLMRGEGMQPAAMQRVKPPLELNPSAAGLPGLMMYNDPSLPGTGTAGYVMVGDDNAKNPAMAQAMFLNPKDGNKADTIAHETEHLLARQNLGRGSNINTKFDELIGDQNGLKRIQFVQKAVEAGPYLKEKYGLESAYFKPEMVEFQGRRAKNLLYEQLASLSALEQRHKVDLTKDPELRKTLFARPDVRETYNALTGLRQTRLDPRDLPPHTRVREPGMLDAIKGVFKRAEGGPVYRADGSPEEGERLTPQQIERIAAQEAAEREAASTAAFIAQKSGIGRKAGPVSQALQSGQGYVEAAKGFTMLPQNLVGAPMDISNMIANVYGGGVEKPFMGSQYIKEGLRERGLGFTPPTDPTLAAFYGAGDLGSNLVNPAGVTRAGVQAAGKTGEAAKMLARDFQQYNQNLAVPGASYAVRNKGTPVAMTGLPFLPNVNEAEKVVKAVTIGQRKEPLDVTDKSLSDWFSKTVTRYLRSDFASPQDQLVRAAEEGKALHLAPKEFSDSAEDQILKTFLERRQSDLEYMRQAEGFGKSNMATTPYGQRIEDITDISAYPEMVGDLTPNRVPSSMRNIVETQPETRVTDFAPNIVENLKLEALRDKMLDVRQSDGKYGAYGQPAAKIPAEFLLPDDTLAKLNVAAASNRMARYTNWQNETRQKMATTALRADPAFPRAQLQEGKFIGVALPDIKKNPEAKQLVIDVGCDGGWCTRYTPNAEAYASGFNRLHVIVTGEGKQARPVAQFSVADSGVNFDSGRRFSILEIKEKGNTADFANNPALPAIQEYIQHLDKTYGGLDYVDNLKGLRMTQLPEYPNQVLNFFDPSFTQKMDLGQKFGNVENGLRAVRDKAVDLNNGSRFIAGTDTDMGKMLQEATNLLVPTKRPMTLEEIKANIQKRINPSKATGGMIERQADDNRRYL